MVRDIGHGLRVRDLICERVVGSHQPALIEAVACGSQEIEMDSNGRYRRYRHASMGDCSSASTY